MVWLWQWKTCITGNWEQRRQNWTTSLGPSIRKGLGSICFDFVHAFVAEGIQQTLGSLHSHVITLHLCDNMKPDRESTCWPMVPHGLVDWKAAFGELKNKGYDGVMIYEVYGSGQPDLESDDVARLELNYQELIRVFKQC